MFTNDLRPHTSPGIVDTQSEKPPITLRNNFMATVYSSSSVPHRTTDKQTAQENTKKPPRSPYSTPNLTRSPRASNLARVGLYLLNPEDPRIGPQQPTYDPDSNRDRSPHYP